MTSWFAEHASAEGSSTAAQFCRRGKEPVCLFMCFVVCLAGLSVRLRAGTSPIADRN